MLDCSVSMGWCFADEADAYSDGVLDLLSQNEALVPSLWLLETANVLLVAERRKRLTEAQSRRFVELLAALPILVEETTSERTLRGILPLAREQNLSAYDAAYLELAMQAGLPLATRDATLSRTARRCGVALVAPRGTGK